MKIFNTLQQKIPATRYTQRSTSFLHQPRSNMHSKPNYSRITGINRNANWINLKRASPNDPLKLDYSYLPPFFIKKR